MSPRTATAMTSTDPLRALIYTRVSKDPKARGRSVAEQERECRQVCDVEGWDVIDVVTDNHRSASRYAKREREGWTRVMASIAAGDVDELGDVGSQPKPALTWTPTSNSGSCAKRTGSCGRIRATRTT